MDEPGSSSGPARTAAWVDSATNPQEPEPEAEGEDTDHDLLRRVFKAWRTAAVNQHARRVHSNQNEVPLHESESLALLQHAGLMKSVTQASLPPSCVLARSNSTEECEG